MRNVLVLDMGRVVRIHCTSMKGWACTVWKSKRFFLCTLGGKHHAESEQLFSWQWWLDCNRCITGVQCFRAEFHCIQSGCQNRSNGGSTSVDLLILITILGDLPLQHFPLNHQRAFVLLPTEWKTLPHWNANLREKSVCNSAIKGTVHSLKPTDEQVTTIPTPFGKRQTCHHNSFVWAASTLTMLGKCGQMLSFKSSHVGAVTRRNKRLRT